jgi:ABC-type metal ion transport system, periplasmic component/surface adhesin
MLLMAVSVAVVIHLISPKIGSEISKEAQSNIIDQEHKLKIVTTIYPVYLIGLNLTDHIDNIEVKSLIKLNTGCLHDYQLTTKDMKLIATADVLIINGGGMEGFLEDVTANYPNLKIIDASKGIPMISTHELKQTEETAKTDEKSENVIATEKKSEHDHGDFNPHVWLDPQLYQKQVENVRDSLIQFINQNTNKSLPKNLDQMIDANAKTYIQEIQKLDNQLQSCSSELEKAGMNRTGTNQVVIFHDSFAYLASRLGMKVAFAVDLDADTSLSAGNIAAIIDDVNKDGIRNLFTERQFSDSIARQIAEETGTKVTIIDSAVTGDGSKDSYLKAMRNNIEVLNNIAK